MEIGKKIRSQRKTKKMSLSELSQKSGVAIATLSRIETGKMIGTLKSHQAIASALGLNFLELYGDIELSHKNVEFQSMEKRTETFFYNDKASYHMLTSNLLSKKMMPTIVKIAAGGRTVDEELPRQTERFIYILKGECQLHIGKQSHLLKEAETLYFDASIRHYLKNHTDKEVTAISVITPPVL